MSNSRGIRDRITRLTGATSILMHDKLNKTAAGREELHAWLDALDPLIELSKPENQSKLTKDIATVITQVTALEKQADAVIGDKLTPEEQARRDKGYQERFVTTRSDEQLETLKQKVSKQIRSCENIIQTLDAGKTSIFVGEAQKQRQAFGELKKLVQNLQKDEVNKDKQPRWERISAQLADVEKAFTGIKEQSASKRPDTPASTSGGTSFQPVVGELQKRLAQRSQQPTNPMQQSLGTQGLKGKNEEQSRPQSPGPGRK